jgi:hypothetical protein
MALQETTYNWNGTTYTVYDIYCYDHAFVEVRLTGIAGITYAPIDFGTNNVNMTTGVSDNLTGFNDENYITSTNSSYLLKHYKYTQERTSEIVTYERVYPYIGKTDKSKYHMPICPVVMEGFPFYRLIFKANASTSTITLGACSSISFAADLSNNAITITVPLSSVKTTSKTGTTTTETSPTLTWYVIPTSDETTSRGSGTVTVSSGLAKIQYSVTSNDEIYGEEVFIRFNYNGAVVDSCKVTCNIDKYTCGGIALVE